MRSTVLIKWLGVLPFKPFRIILTDGTRYDIRHPDQAIPYYAELHVSVRDPAIHWQVDDFVVGVSYLHIIRIEPILPLFPIEEMNGKHEGPP